MPSNSTSAHSKDVKRRIVERLRDKPFERAFEDETFRKLLDEDALGEAPIFTADAIAGLNEARELRHQQRAATAPSLFFSNKSVLIVPGFLGSQLRDDGPAGNDLIWIDPKLYITSTAQRSELSALQMAPWKEGVPERDRNPNVSSRFAIRSIPTLVVFRDGREATRQVGAVPMSVLEQLVNTH